MDVVVPYARTMADLFEVLDVIVADDPESDGDLWRMQRWIEIPDASAVRPDSYLDLAARRGALAGQRFGVPRMYINADPEAGTGEKTGVWGPTGEKIETRPSVIELWEAARRDLEAAGAEVVEVDFPAVSNYEGDRPGCPTIFNRGLVSPEFIHEELRGLSTWAFDHFLRTNDDPALNRLEQVDGELIFPHDPGTLPSQEGELVFGMEEYVEMARAGIVPWDELPADVGAADADVNPRSAERAWANGVWVANGNLVPRHLGIPTVTVPMGLMEDIGMPVGLTFAGRAYDDNALLTQASAFEAIRPRRVAPPRTS
jgi:amidase